MNLPDYLTLDADGHIHLTGHRIGLQDLVYYYNEGYSAEAMLDALPTLSLATIHKVIGHYLENQVNVDAYVAMCDAEMDRQRAVAPRGPDAAELRRRLAVKEAAKA
jgi:uncharacterized protein (DUF433 family)